MAHTENLDFVNDFGDPLGTWFRFRAEVLQSDLFEIVTLGHMSISFVRHDHAVKGT